MSSIREQVTELLNARPMKAKDLASELGVAKKIINNFLYSNPQFHKQEDQTWIVIPPEPEPSIKMLEKDYLIEILLIKAATVPYLAAKLKGCAGDFSEHALTNLFENDPDFRKLPNGGWIFAHCDPEEPGVLGRPPPFGSPLLETEEYKQAQKAAEDRRKLDRIKEEAIQSARDVEAQRACEDEAAAYKMEYNRHFAATGRELKLNDFRKQYRARSSKVAPASVSVQPEPDKRPSTFHDLALYTDDNPTTFEEEESVLIQRANYHRSSKAYNDVEKTKLGEAKALLSKRGYEHAPALYHHLIVTDYLFTASNGKPKQHIGHCLISKDEAAVYTFPMIIDRDGDLINLRNPSNEFERLRMQGRLSRLEMTSETPFCFAQLRKHHAKSLEDSLIVVGSRSLTMDKSKSIITDLVVNSKYNQIILGDAKGVDTSAMILALRAGKKVVQYSKKDYKTPSHRDYYMINETNCDIVAIWDGESKGTARTIAMYRNRVDVYQVR